MKNVGYKLKICVMGIFILLMAEKNIFAQNSISITQIDSLMIKNAKPIVILLTTDWCQYCQTQKIQLDKNSFFKAHQNQFYYTTFNAESKNAIIFNNKLYNYKSNGNKTGIHELALKLSEKEARSYPSWVILDENYKLLLTYNGLMLKDQIDLMVKSIIEYNNYKNAK